MRKQFKGLCRCLIPLLFWLAIWEFSYRAIGQDLLLASPAQVAAYFAGGMDARFFACVGMTLARTALAYACGIAAGSLLAVVCHACPLLGEIIRPALAIVRATPVASFIILALVWLSASNVPILAGMLMVAPVVFASVREGVASADPQLLEMARMFGWSRLKTWRRIRILSAASSFFAACETCIGMCFKATIAAEVIGTPKNAMGTQLYQAKIYLETDALMAWTVAVILLSMLFERLLRLALERGRRRVHQA